MHQQGPFSTIVTALLLSNVWLLSAYAAAPKLYEAHNNVQATYWSTSKWEANCLFRDWQAPKSMPYFTAVAKNLYQGAAYCGACVAVTQVGSKRRPVVGIINDQCADCPDGALDMAPAMYNAVMGNAPGRPGIGKISWTVVPCPSGSPVKLIKKDGSSRWHLSLQIAGTRVPLARVVFQIGDKWYDGTRQNYNYWEMSQEVKLTPVINVRAVCTNGAHFTVTDVKLDDHSPMTIFKNC